ncbi:MAG: hypothetical protein AAGF36_09695, partial [Pseudomonadota bacterium]
MLSAAQVAQFQGQGYLVLEDVIPSTVLDGVRAEYSALMDGLYAGWEAKGLVPAGTDLDFWGKLSASYAGGCDWFQPMDISLPGGEIKADCPMHFGPAIFDLAPWQADVHWLKPVAPSGIGCAQLAPEIQICPRGD